MNDDNDDEDEGFLRLRNGCTRGATSWIYCRGCNRASNQVAAHARACNPAGRLVIIAGVVIYRVALPPRSRESSTSERSSFVPGARVSINTFYPKIRVKSGVQIGIIIPAEVRIKYFYLER